MNGKKDVIILYSGGSDSTLTAYLMAKRFNKIHLITYNSYAMIGIKGSNVNFITLCKIFGKEKFVRKIIDIDSLIKKVYYENYLQDLIKYGAYLVAFCNACKAAMHLSNIKYALENNIKFVCSGSTKASSDVQIDQSSKFFPILKKFYKKYGITYFTPVHDIVRTDEILYELGLIKKKEIKFPSRHYMENQAGCWHGALHRLFFQCAYIPLYGQEKFEKTAINYCLEKLEKNYLDLGTKQ